MKKEIVLGLCLTVIVISVGVSVLSPGFSDWGGKEVAKYYIREGLIETKAPSILNAIVWDYRAFDTLGEEIVLFTAAVGVFTVMVFGIREKGKEREKIGR